VFDKASRGAWGSILLLFCTKGKSLAALGALLTILLLAIDTFFQQVTSLPGRWTPRGEGLIPRAIRYEPEVVYTFSSASGGIPTAMHSQDMKGAITPYFYDQNGTEYSTSRNGSQSNFPFACPTSVCKWDPCPTLGVCSACVDIASLLTYACLPMKMDWIRSSAGPTKRTPIQMVIRLLLADIQPLSNCVLPGTACGSFLNATSAAPVLLSGYRIENTSNSTYGETLLMRTLPLVKNPSRQTLYGGSINCKNLSNPILDAIIVSAADGSASSVIDRSYLLPTNACWRGVSRRSARHTPEGPTKSV
jgi:hypothetical protein